MRVRLAFIALLLMLCSACLRAEIVAPGVEYTVYNLPHPNVAYVIKMDVTRPEYKLKMGFPEKKRNYSARETVTTISGRYDSPTHKVVAAVNGSFYEVGIGINGILCGSNDYIQFPTSTWETYMFADARWSRIDRNIGSSGSKVTLPNNSTVTIDRINYTRSAGQLICYTPVWDTSTRTTVEGTEVILSGVSYPLRPDKEISGIVTAVRTGAQSLNNPIPAGGMVLSAEGSKASALAGVNVGDRIRVFCDVSNITYNNMMFAITGAGWIVCNGAAYTSTWSNYSDSFKGRHPRTLIAWNNTHLFLIAVDGRQDFSVGMSFQEMADFCIDYLGATNAINLDGGGSTTMVVNGQLKNSPSGGTQRAIANAVLLVKEDTSTSLPVSDSFPSTGRTLTWDDKFTYNPVSAFSPTSPGGDGYVVTVMDPAGGAETIHVGDLSDEDYAVQADIYCQYRPEVSGNGYERCGIYARDNGNNAFTLTTVGGGNCYLMAYDTNNGRVRAGKVVNGSLTDFLQSSPIYRTTSAWRNMRIEAVGPNIKYYLDGQLIADVQDSTFSRGYAGIGFHELFSTNANMLGTRADNFVMESILPPGPTDAEIAWAKEQPIGTTVQMVSVPVTAAFPLAGMFYVTDGSSGIGVRKNAAVPVMPSVGKMVSIVGQTAYAPSPYSQEVIVVPTEYSLVGGDANVSPLAMINRSTGGGSLGLQSAVTDKVASPPRSASGLNNVGTLVIVWGNLTSEWQSGDRFCWIDDGSGLNDGTGQGIRVDLSEVGNTLPAGNYFRTTGILRCGTSSGPEALPIRVLWPRSPEDIIPYP